MIKVLGGIMEAQAHPGVSAIVDRIEFANGKRVNGVVRANGGKIIMFLKRVPDRRNFEMGELLDYSDSNRHNDATFRVANVIGPCKYELLEHQLPG